MSLASNNLYRTLMQNREMENKTSRLAKVTKISGQSVYVTFFGETEQSRKSYKRLESYTPSVGDTVMLQNINGSYVITGKVI